MRKALSESTTISAVSIAIDDIIVSFFLSSSALIMLYM